MTRNSSEKTDPYGQMPAEQELRHQINLGGGTRADLEVLLEICAAKGSPTHSLGMLLQIFYKMPSYFAKYSPVFFCLVFQVFRNLLIRKLKSPKCLRIVFFYEHEYFLACIQSVIRATESHKILITRDLEEIILFRPDAILSPQSNPNDIIRLRRELPSCLFVYLRHGIAHKMHAIATASYYDKVCVSSQFTAEPYLRLGGFPKKTIWVTGYAQCDDLIIEQCKTRTRSILFAPTHNVGLSSADWITPQYFEELLERALDWELMIKVHPNKFGSPTWNRWKEFGQSHPRVTFLEDRMLNVASYLPSTDLLISDFSSVSFLFLPFNRPIVLLTPPATFSVKSFDLDGVEWTCRDMALEVDDLSEFVDVVTKCMAHPDLQSEQRAVYSSRIFENTLDGKCGQRIISEIEAQFGCFIFRILNDKNKKSCAMR